MQNQERPFLQAEMCLTHTTLIMHHEFVSVAAEAASRFIYQFWNAIIFIYNHH